MRSFLAAVFSRGVPVRNADSFRVDSLIRQPRLLQRKESGTVDDALDERGAENINRPLPGAHRSAAEALIKAMGSSTFSQAALGLAEDTTFAR